LNAKEYRKKRKQAREKQERRSEQREQINALTFSMEGIAKKTIAAIEAIPNEIVAAADAVRAQFEAQEQKEAPAKKEKNCREKWGFWINVGTLAFVGVYTIITIFIWCTSRDTEHKQLRAYVGLPGTDKKMFSFVCPDCELPTSMKDAESRDSLSVTFKNFGTTPAYRPTNCIRVVPIPINTEISTPKAMDALEKCSTIKRRTIWPQEDATYHFTFDEPQIDIFRRVRRKQFGTYKQFDAYVVGSISYDDIFDKPHKSYICFKYEVINGQGWLVDCENVFGNEY
jgi:hypothetical protein